MRRCLRGRGLVRSFKGTSRSLSSQNQPDQKSLQKKSIKYCQDLVKKHDYDHYLCTLLLPQHVQAAAFAVRAFNVEVALIHDVVTEHKIGNMRIQFWRDLLENVYKGTPPQQPFAVALDTVMQSHRLSKHWFSRILDARAQELSTTAYLSTRGMEEYAENTFSSLLYLTLEAAGVRDVNADHAASHIGKAEGIVTLLRSMGYYRSRRRVLIPMDILLRHEVSQEDIFRKAEATQPLRDAVFDFASLAHSHLSKAKSLEKHLSPATKRVLLPSVVCEKFLKRIQVVNFDPFTSHLVQRDPTLPGQLLWRVVRRTY